MTALLWPLGGILLVLMVVLVVNRAETMRSSAAFGWLRDLQIFTTDRFGSLVLGAAQTGAGALVERSGGDERLQVIVQLSRTLWPLVHDRQREFEYHVAELIEAELYERSAGQLQPEFTVMANLDLDTETYRIDVRVAPDVTQRPTTDGEPGIGSIEAVVARLYVGAQRTEFAIPAGGYVTVGHRDRAPSPPSVPDYRR